MGFPRTGVLSVLHGTVRIMAPLNVFIYNTEMKEYVTVTYIAIKIT